MSNRPGRKLARKGSQARRRGAAAPRPRSSLTWWIAGGLGALVLAALLVAVAVGESGRGSDGDVPQVATVQVVGDSLPVFDTTDQDPAAGLPAPTVVGSQFDGTEVVVEPGGGRAKLLVFFAHWCSHCQRELPRLTAWLEANEVPDGIDVIGVSTAVDPRALNYPPSTWFEDVGWPQPVIRDSSEGAIADHYAIGGFPFFVVADRQGSVVARVSGELTTGQWEALLEQAAS